MDLPPYRYSVYIFVALSVHSPGALVWPSCFYREYRAHSPVAVLKPDRTEPLWLLDKIKSRSTGLRL
jgi:hypothetical protein